MRSRVGLAVLAAVAFALPVVGAPSSATPSVHAHQVRAADHTVRITRNPAAPHPRRSGGGKVPSISADGRKVAFTSYYGHYVADDDNHAPDAFVWDDDTGRTLLVSRNSHGVVGNHQSGADAISADGRWVLLQSGATNLVRGDTNGRRDLFVRDLIGRTTELVSVASNGSQANRRSINGTISRGGRYVAFISEASNLDPNDLQHDGDVFVRDRLTGTTEQVARICRKRCDGVGSSDAEISANGRFVVFTSPSADIVAGDTNGRWDVFVYDRTTGSTQRVSITSTEEQLTLGGIQPAISANGRYVAFISNSPNLAPTRANGKAQVFVRDRVAGTTRIASLSPDGSAGNRSSYYPDISADGRFVTFESDAGNLGGGARNAEDVFIRDRAMHRTELISVQLTPRTALGSYDASVAAGGRIVCFMSSEDLTREDLNRFDDVFLRYRTVKTSAR